MRPDPRRTVVCNSNSVRAGTGPPEGQARSSRLGRVRNNPHPTGSVRLVKQPAAIASVTFGVVTLSSLLTSFALRGSGEPIETRPSSSAIANRNCVFRRHFSALDLITSPRPSFIRREKSSNWHRLTDAPTESQKSSRCRTRSSLNPSRPAEWGISETWATATAIRCWELWPKVGEGVNRGRRHIVGVFEPPLLHRRSDMPCPTIPLSN